MDDALPDFNIAFLLTDNGYHFTAKDDARVSPMVASIATMSHLMMVANNDRVNAIRSLMFRFIEDVGPEGLMELDREFFTMLSEHTEI